MSMVYPGRESDALGTGLSETTRIPAGEEIQLSLG
jgi:hypothetical protein